MLQICMASSRRYHQQDKYCWSYRLHLVKNDKNVLQNVSSNARASNEISMQPQETLTVRTVCRICPKLTKKKLVWIYWPENSQHSNLKNSISIKLNGKYIYPWKISKATFPKLSSAIIPLSANPTKWSNTLKQIVGKSRRIVCVCLTVLWGWCLKVLCSVHNARFLKYVWTFFDIMHERVKYIIWFDF